MSARFATLLLLAAASGGGAEAQTFRLEGTDLLDSAALARSMPRLAADVMAAYSDTNRLRFLDNLFRLELLTGKYDEAARTLAEARMLRTRSDSSPAARAVYVQYAIHARAKALEANTGRPFPQAFADAFRDVFGTLDDRSAAVVARAITVSAPTVANDLWWATPDQSGKTTVSLDEALTLLRVYSAVVAYRAFSGLPGPLVAEDDERRYTIEKHIPVRTPDGATVCATIARPRNVTARLPALLQFTIYADSISTLREATRAAAHGYAGVIGFTRGKACSRDEIVPYVHDGADAAALIDWIAAQSWSDGRVGMYGGSYSGFTAWAAAKHAPTALEAIMVGAPVAPAIDVPMEGNVFWSFVYPWPFYTMNDRWLDNATYLDNDRWNGVYTEWYRTGRPYNELDEIDGTPNPAFTEWLAHPTVDSYWKATIPQGEEYTRIDIPVLQTAGYFFGGPGGALHYFLEHYRYNPAASHYLLIGPYEHFQAQRGVVTALGDTATYLAGYEIDPVAQIDIVADLRYQWFDHVLRGGPRPALLADRVNYQVMGANVWKHAPSLPAMSNGSLRLYLSPERWGDWYRLRDSPTAGAFVTHTVDLSDRSDASGGTGLVDTTLDVSNGIAFVSEPLAEATEVSGVLSGRLELVTNKRDFDFTITPYELTADGRYIQLPPYTSRASHVESLSQRRLLEPGRRERLEFANRVRMMSRRCAQGSRLVVVLSVVKNPGQQINYGTGKDVSEESIVDAGDPLTIRWFANSHVDIPVMRSVPAARNP